MRQRVFDETKLTVSAGIAANKVCSNRFRTNSLMPIVDFQMLAKVTSSTYQSYPGLTLRAVWLRYVLTRYDLLLDSWSPDTSLPLGIE